MRNTPLLAALTMALTLILASPAAADPPSLRTSSLEQANTALARSSRASRMMLTLLDEARRSGNAQKSQCVDRALSQINSFTQNLEQRRDRLRDAIARGDETEAAHQQRVIRTVYAQVRARQAAGRACLYGDVPVGHNVTVVEMYVDEEVPRHRDLSADAFRSRRW
ncbi:MAG: hypothetical protein AB8I08_20065 [Sandaracinaceae bacterium]